MWNPHIEFLLSKMSSSCFVISRLSYLLGTDATKTPYYSHFHSLIKYDIFSGKFKQLKYFYFKKRTIRIMIVVRLRWSCRGLFKEIDIQPVSSEYTFPSMMFTVNKFW